MFRKHDRHEIILHTLQLDEKVFRQIRDIMLTEMSRINAGNKR